MGLWAWIHANGIDLLQTTSLVVGLYITVQTFRANTNERKIQNLLTLTAAHRELWMHFEREPELWRVRDPHADLEKHPLTPKEAWFVHLLILHLRASYKAKRIGMEFNDEAMRLDIRQFFRRPVPMAAWKKSRAFQDRDFVAFVESAMEAAPEREQESDQAASPTRRA